MGMVSAQLKYSWRVTGPKLFTRRVSTAENAKAVLEPAPENKGKPPTMPERFVNSLPANWQPYARLSRLDKPIGTWLLYTPGTWSITMAAYATGAPVMQTVYMLALFGVGALVTRGAGCTINDMWDRKLDAGVARTMLRPLASGQVTMPQAWGWLAAQCFGGLGILLLLPPACWLLGAASMIPVFLYPSFKRFTYYPQACLSFCFTWAALLGFPAMGMMNWPAMLSLWGSSFAWCMIYDTIYAHQDKLFDISVGIKSTALKWKERSKEIMYRYEVVQIGLLALSGAIVGMGPGFFAATGYAAYRIWDMIKRVNLDDPSNCWQWFLRNIYTGHAIFGGALFDYGMRILGVY